MPGLCIGSKRRRIEEEARCAKRSYLRNTRKHVLRKRRRDDSDTSAELIERLTCETERLRLQKHMQAIDGSGAPPVPPPEHVSRMLRESALRGFTLDSSTFVPRPPESTFLQYHRKSLVRCLKRSKPDPAPITLDLRAAHNEGDGGSDGHPGTQCDGAGKSDPALQEEAMFEDEDGMLCFLTPGVVRQLREERLKSETNDCDMECEV